MPSPTRGTPVTIDRERRFRFSLATLRQIEEELGGLENIASGGMGALIRVIYLGLKHEDADLTEDQVGEMVDSEMLPDVMLALERAMGGDRLASLFGEEQPNASAPAGDEERTEGNGGAAAAQE